MVLVAHADPGHEIMCGHVTIGGHVITGHEITGHVKTKIHEITGQDLEVRYFAAGTILTDFYDFFLQ